MTTLLSPVRPLVDAAIGSVCTACVVRVERGGRAETYAAGSLDPEGEDAPCTSDTLFDLASLTKLATAALVLTYVRDEALAFDTPFVELVAAFPRRDVTLLQVLTHTAGLAWWVPLYKEARGLEAVVARASVEPLAHEPGPTFVYSDLGYIMLTSGMARLGDKPYERLVEERVLGPLGVASVEMRYLPDEPERCAATELDQEWRGRRLRGEVHDENAFAMGGIAGHAGLFGTARAVAKLMAVFREGAAIGGKLASEARREHASGENGRYGIGVQLKAREGSLLGRYFSADSYGHTGFVGTSVFVDPERDLTVVLLTNRVYFGRADEPIRAFRVAVHEALTSP